MKQVTISKLDSSNNNLPKPREIFRNTKIILGNQNCWTESTLMSANMNSLSKNKQFYIKKLIRIDQTFDNNLHRKPRGIVRKAKTR